MHNPRTVVLIFYPRHLVRNTSNRKLKEAWGGGLAIQRSCFLLLPGTLVYHNHTHGNVITVCVLISTLNASYISGQSGWIQERRRESGQRLLCDQPRRPKAANEIPSDRTTDCRDGATLACRGRERTERWRLPGVRGCIVATLTLMCCCCCCCM